MIDFLAANWWIFGLVGLLLAVGTAALQFRVIVGFGKMLNTADDEDLISGLAKRVVLPIVCWILAVANIIAGIIGVIAALIDRV